MHEENEENYQRGYEWWLMKEAKKRNPNIKLWGLSWAWPHWLGNPATHQPYLNLTKTATYTINWILGAKREHNLTIDYVGIWNEKVCNFDYILTLRKALNDNNLQNVEVVACDGKFDQFYLMAFNQTLLDAIYAIGVHYPGTKAPSLAIDSNKTLWSSEDYSTYNDDVGAGCWARTLNQNYVNGYMTSTISWNLIASYYYGLPYQQDGLMTAVQPWSGYYEVSNPIWITAHTTQFTQIGWSYLKHNSGVGKLKNGGSYVSIVSPNQYDITIVIETMSHDHSICIRPPLPAYNVTNQTATFTFGGQYKYLQNLWLWRSHLTFDGSPNTIFKPYGLVPVVDGSITLNLEIDSIYTLTTVNRGEHGFYDNDAVSSAFPLPYVDDFQNYNISQEPYYLTPQVGSWEIVQDGTVQYAKQTVTVQPVPWCDINPYPIAVIGDNTWTSLNVTAKLRIPSTSGTDSVFVAVRLPVPPGCQLYALKGLFFWISKNDSKYKITQDITGLNNLASGKLSFTVQPDQWYVLSLVIDSSSTLTAYINQEKLTSISAPPTAPANGFGAVGSSSFGYSDLGYLSLCNPDL